ncbi:MAG: hypothetical protein NTV51_12450 [Verrucomicrobia bacterium]|nr:hypothetical protein [Verrucomicrobiota bacterium]
MPSPRRLGRSRLALGSVLLLVAAPWLSAAVQSDYRPRAALPSVLARAEREKLPTAGIDPAADATTLRPGDFVTVLVTLTEGSREQQWLAEFPPANAPPAWR